MPPDTQGQRPARTPTFTIVIPRRVALFTIWLATTVIGTFFAMINKDSALVDGAYIPRSNDSFYHARRILDAISSGGLPVQFDTRLHVPEGTWVPWPWAYDYLMAQAARLVQWLWPTVDSMAFLSHVPVAWVAVNAALFLAGASALGLSLNMRALAMLCFALSPLTQILHSIGMVDHHYVELTFVLLTVWLGLRWFERPDDGGRAAWLGAVLGISQAFHNGLFLLQLPVVVTVTVLWLRRIEPPRKPLVAFSIALLLATQAALLPSAPYREGIFEFGLLSWFHAYIALATVLAVLYMSWRPRTSRGVVGLVSLGGLLATPLVLQVLGGALFISGKFSVLGQIIEVASPYRLATQVFGVWDTLSWYSGLVLLAPFLLAYFAFRAFLDRDGKHLFFSVTAVFGLALLLTQFRFHTFGSFALVAGGMLVVDRLRFRFGLHEGIVFVAVFSAIVMAYQPSLRGRLFMIYPPSSEKSYASVIPGYRILAAACAEDPGIVLAHHDDGNAILYHTQCSVFSNNFVLRPQDDAKIRESKRVIWLQPQEIRAYQPHIKYVFLRTMGYGAASEQLDFSANEYTTEELLMSENPPEGFTPLWTNRIEWVPGMDVYARIYKITR